jgi:hypothetical protein
VALRNDAERYLGTVNLFKTGSQYIFDSPDRKDEV